MKKILVLILCSINLLYGKTTEEEFKKIIKASLAVSLELKNSNKDKVFVNATHQKGMFDFWWKVEQENASYVSSDSEDGEKQHYVTLMGGLAKNDYLQPDGILLLACHELGHAFGKGIQNIPLKYGKATTIEGEADYYATAKCFNKALNHLESLRDLSDDLYISKLCLEQKVYPFTRCHRIVDAIKSFAEFLNSISGGNVSIESKDDYIETVINKTAGYYPSDQCRIDTFMAGAFKKRRPKCFYP